MSQSIDFYTSTVPVAFSGTEEERQSNRESHNFSYDCEEVRCFNCDSRPSHTAADYPCGTKVPRATV